MIKHIAMWTFKDHAEGAGKAANLQKAKRLMEGCAQLIPGTRAFEVALAVPGKDCTYDLILYSEFETWADLDAYQEHPDHVAIKPFVMAARQDRQCMDYEI